MCLCKQGRGEGENVLLWGSNSICFLQANGTIFERLAAWRKTYYTSIWLTNSQTAFYVKIPERFLNRNCQTTNVKKLVKISTDPRRNQPSCIESNRTLTWTWSWTPWGSPPTRRWCSWPGSVAPGCVSCAWPVGPADPTVGPGPPCCAPCTWTNIDTQTLSSTVSTESQF